MAALDIRVIGLWPKVHSIATLVNRIAAAHVVIIICAYTHYLCLINLLLYSLCTRANQSIVMVLTRPRDAFENTRINQTKHK